MNKNNDNKLVPKLRFAEFLNIPSWYLKALSDVANVYQPKTISQSELTNNGYLVYGANGVIGYYDKYNHETSQIAIACRGSSCGTVNFTEPKSWITGNAMVVYTDDYNEVDKKFLFYQLFAADLNYLITGSGQPQITGNIKSHKVVLTNLYEQQKIAACLSSLDEVITAESKKLELLKEHKKGLLQNLFPQEGERVPKLRFKEFEDCGEWEEKLIEQYFNVGSSKRVLQEDWTNYGVPFFRTRELVSLSKNEPFRSEVFISEELFSELKERYGVPTEGDFLVSGVGTLGVCYQVQANDKYYFKDGNVLWFKLESGINSTYFKYCFQSDHIQNQIIGQTSKSTVGTYTIQNAKKTKFWLPSTYQEQQKIASCLSSLDDLINAQNQKIETLKLHKKGLLQGLFPDINEQNG